MSRNSGNDFMSLLTGAALGAIGALLYAPKKGEDLRKDIKGYADDFADDAQDRLERRKADLQLELARIERQLSDRAAELEEKAEEVKLNE